MSTEQPSRNRDGRLLEPQRLSAEKTIDSESLRPSSLCGLSLCGLKCASKLFAARRDLSRSVWSAVSLLSLLPLWKGLGRAKSAGKPRDSKHFARFASGSAALSYVYHSHYFLISLQVLPDPSRRAGSRELVMR
jgi:hypothetical protein